MRLCMAVTELIIDIFDDVIKTLFSAMNYLLHIYGI